MDQNQVISSEQASKTLDSILSDVSNNHAICNIIGAHGEKVVVISKEEYDNLLETLFIMKDPELAASLLKNMKEPYENCSTTLDE